MHLFTVASLSKYNGLIKLIKVMPIIKAPLDDKVNNGEWRRRESTGKPLLRRAIAVFVSCGKY